MMRTQGITPWTTLTVAMAMTYVWLPVTCQIGRRDVTGRWNLTLLGLFPMSGGWSGGHMALVAAQLALDHINDNAAYLPDYRLNIEWVDTKCNPSLGVDGMYRLLYSEPIKVGIVGDGCSPVSEATAMVSHLWNLNQVSYLSVSPTLSNKVRFPNFFRVSVPEAAINFARVAFLKEMGWRKVALITERIDPFQSLVEDLVPRLEEENITVITIEVYSNQPARDIQNIKEHDARIIIAGVYQDKIFNFFCEVYKHGLYGPRYVWMLVGWYDDHWWRSAQDTQDCTRDQILAAIDGHVTVGERLSVGLNSIFPGYMNPRQLMRLMDSAVNISNPSGANMMARAYDVAWTFALALDSLERQLERRGGRRLRDFRYDDAELGFMIRDSLRRVNFTGLSGRVAFNANQEQLALLKVAQIIDDSSNMIYLYDPATATLTKLYNLSFGEGNIIPRDSTLFIKSRQFIGHNIYITMCALAGVGIVFVLGCLAFNIRYRNTRTIKLTSPNINTLILFGCILIYSTVFFIETHEGPTIYFCYMRTSLLSIGFSLTFGALFAKTWRVHFIFRRVKPRQVVKDRTLYLQIFSLVSLNIVALVVWGVADPLYVVTHNTTQTTLEAEDIVMQMQVTLCESHYQPYFTFALYFIHGVVMLIGTFLAWETRNVKVEDLNDSRLIAQCIYNAVVFSLLSLTFAYILDNGQRTVLYGLNSAFLLFGTTINVVLLFLPKMTKFRDIRDEDQGTGHRRKTVTDMHLRNGRSEEALSVMEDRVSRLENSLVEKDETIRQLTEQLKMLKSGEMHRSSSEPEMHRLSLPPHGGSISKSASNFNVV